MILAIFLGCEASVFYIASKILKNYQIILIPIRPLSTKFGIIIDPFDYQNYFKFLDINDVCEASAILVCPFGMSFLQHLHMSK